MGSSVIDIHSHLLPAVDDGSPSIAVSVGVLERFRDAGVETLVCTPHLTASEAGRVRHEEYAARFAELCAAAPAVPALRLGFEIMLDVPGADITAPHLALGGSRAVLVEFPRAGVPPGSTAELRRLRDSGVVPVVAHPERYRNCTADLVREWREAGALIQTDGMMLLGGGPPARLAREMLTDGLIDCIASDNHGDSRSLGGVRHWLLELGAPAAARLLTRDNAERVLLDQPPLPVPPVRVPGGPLVRLRQLLRGGR
jgi:protein-tyrosine phosphatase